MVTQYYTDRGGKRHVLKVNGKKGTFPVDADKRQGKQTPAGPEKPKG